MKDFNWVIKTNQSPNEVFELLLNIDQWWSGVFGETITGKSKEVLDEFEFSAGGGMHQTKQKLVELIPDKKLVWQVTESNLSFLDNPKEWEGTELIFEIDSTTDQTQIFFTHKGLNPEIECYVDCSFAWTQYMTKLQEKLKEYV